MYSNGGNEEIAGRALKDFTNRDSVVIATKAAPATRNGPNAIGLSRKAIMTEIDRSLKRLGTDYVDLCQINRRDQFTPWEETLEALLDLVKVGKSALSQRFLHEAREFSKALHLQKANGWARFVSLQDAYNLLGRKEEEREMLPLGAYEGVQTIVYSPLARGRQRPGSKCPPPDIITTEPRSGEGPTLPPVLRPMMDMQNFNGFGLH
jgi:aryl-alcohol dehydrogenase-like predicted oxidoreductase